MWTRLRPHDTEHSGEPDRRDGAVDVVNLRGKADSALPRPAETRVCGRRERLVSVVFMIE